MSNSGDYIKLFRSLLEWEWYSDINTCRLFIHMLLKANWKDGNFQGKEIKRGSFVSSIKTLANETKLTEREVRTAISHLKSTQEVTSKSYNKYSVFTVVNYDSYQVNDTQNDNQPTINRQANDKLTTTIEERKKERKKDNNTISNDIVRQTEVRQALVAWNELGVLGIKQVSRLTPNSQRCQRLVARIKEYGIDEVLFAIGKIRRSKFLQGKSSSKRAWVITFDWFVCPNNFPKVHDGNYDDDERLVDNASEEADDGRQ